MSTAERIRAAAEDLRAALAGYDPESMRQVVRELPILGEALAEVSAGLRAVADRSESQWPAGGAVTEGLRSMANEVRNAADTAGVAEDTAHAHHQPDIERHDAPRRGRAAESRWDVARPDTGTTSAPAPSGGRHRTPDQRQEATVPPTPTEQPAAPKSGYNQDQPRAADGKWIKVGDVLGVADEDVCWGSDQVKGAGPVPTNLALMDYDGHKDEPGWGGGGQYVEVATPPPDKPGDKTAWPNLSPDEAETAAGQLEDLAGLAESGYRPPKPSKHARAAQRLQHMIDEGNASPDDPIGVGMDDEFPLTHRELLQLLCDKDPAGVTGTARRKVAARANAAAGGEHGVLWMDLEPGPQGTRIAVTAIEGDSDTPDDEFWKPYTAHHTPDSARELAGKLRAFARAARKRPATT